jgi:hypothetical protein
MSHIWQGTTTSPYVSLTCAYGVAADYALHWSRAKPTPAQPAYVYEVVIPDPPRITMIDPIRDVAIACPKPTAAVRWQHDGPPSILLGFIGGRQRYHLNRPAPRPPGFTGVAAPTALSDHFKTLLSALRDAEILVLGTIPASYIVHRYDIY